VCPEYTTAGKAKQSYLNCWYLFTLRPLSFSSTSSTTAGIDTVTPRHLWRLFSVHSVFILFLRYSKALQLEPAPTCVAAAALTLGHTQHGSHKREVGQHGIHEAWAGSKA
jgi:hypothetical protein